MAKRTKNLAQQSWKSWSARTPDYLPKGLSDNQRAQLLVGAFLHQFSTLESFVDDALRALLSIESHVYTILTTPIDFADKVRILQGLVRTGDSLQGGLASFVNWPKYNELFEFIVSGVAATRNVIAHTFFAWESKVGHLPGVKFYHLQARPERKNNMYTGALFLTSGDFEYWEQEMIAAAVEVGQLDKIVAPVKPNQMKSFYSGISNVAKPLSGLGQFAAALLEPYNPSTK